MIFFSKVHGFIQRSATENLTSDVTLRAVTNVRDLMHVIKYFVFPILAVYLNIYLLFIINLTSDAKNVFSDLFLWNLPNY